MITPILALLLRASAVLSGTVFVTFTLLWYAPGDPALAIAMARFDAIVPLEVVEQIRAESGLSAGFFSAFYSWITPLLVGDFGNSSVTGRPVWPDLASAMGYTFPLALMGLLIGLAIAIPLAILATRRAGSWLDRLSIAIASLGAAIPPYWLGLLLILLFTVKLNWLPAMGARTFSHMVLPSITLGLGVAAALTRIIRSGILEAKHQPFMPAFKRRGLSNRLIGRDHVMPHAAIPVITVFGLELAFLLEGAVMVEVIFGRPGLGSFLVKAIEARDFPKVQGVVILTAVFFVVINMAIDLLYRLIDPRIGKRNA
ncbi:ABC transporter permease [Vibrio sp. RC27]